METTKLLLALLIASIIVDGVNSVQKYYMEDDCGMVINMDEDDIAAGRLLVTRRFKYRNQFSCYVTVVAPSNKRLIVVFRTLDIEFESNCDDDYVQILDGFTPDSPLISGFPGRLCGKSAPSRSYTSSGRNLTVYFKSDIQNRKNGFDLVFTAFHQASVCHQDELHCTNGRCIDARLSCNGMDNCGDGSDECKVSYETAYAIILSVFLLTIIAIGLVTVHRRRKKAAKSKVQEKRVCYNHCSQLAPCLTCQLTNMNPSWVPELSPAPEMVDTVTSKGNREPEVFCIDGFKSTGIYTKRRSV